ncbi:MAG: acyltransferase 3 [Myxococcaceae bacterium]|nr:acyltransferase 3 [Myxococcaceae bacterium]
MRSLPHNPALDGIRALGMFVVMVSHLQFLPGGYVFIDTFFVLSGFLISTLLLIEREKTGTVSIRQFYLRRAFRLFPAYLVYLAVGAVLVVALNKSEASKQMFLENALTSLFYVNNYYRPWHLDAGTWFEHMWSLSVEEQFYLLWPLCFSWLAAKPLRRANMLKILLIAAAFFATLRIALVFLGVSQEYIYLALETRADELLVGCALAVWRYDGFRTPWNPAGTPEGTPPGKLVRTLAACGPLAFAGLLLLICTVPGIGHQPWWFGTCAYSCMALFSTVLILALDQGTGWFHKFLGLRPIAALGRISYGFYLWHWPVCVVIGLKILPRLGPVLGTLAVWLITLALAVLSWNLVEQPMQRWRSSRLKREKAKRALELKVALPDG